MLERSSDRDALLDAARGLGETIRAAAPEAERNGTIAPSIVEALIAARLFDAYRPKEFGGLDVDPLTLFELIEEIASHDGSTGWCLSMGGIIGGFAASRLEDKGAVEVFGSGRAVMCAGGLVPRLRASPVDGGYRVNGRFPFASGCRHAEWMVVTGIRKDASGPASMYTFCVPKDEVHIVDNWQVAGLEGTASNDLDLEDVFVPASRAFPSMTAPVLRGGPLWQLPILPTAALGHLGFSLGSGRRALDEIAAYAETQRFGSSAPIAERPVFQRDYARARTRLRAARLAALESFEAVAVAGVNASPAQRAELAAATVNAYQTATAAAEFAFRAGGASSIYRGGALQRCFRDLQAGSNHVVASDEGFERAGQVMLGVGNQTFL